jgi:tellurite resistance protein/phosphotransferase system HPr-like phosphotransfer protein
MSESILASRRAGLEEAFFARHNEELRQRMLQADAEKFRKETLMAATGIVDDAVLARLMALQIGTGTLAALTLVPMVLVAWADGAISAEEHRAILAGAKEAGLQQGGPALELLEAWLHTRPAPALFQAWKDYVAALTHTLTPEERRSLESSVLAQAHKVASATGSFLGLTSPISDSENKVLRELAASFHPPA